jgi:STAS-like domain of unknown function (DUF4325)
MPDQTVSIADFSQFPAGRSRRDGPFSAERFRDDVLVPALKAAIESNSRVTVRLDGVLGYSSSFLEETFGGLIRLGEFRPEVLRRTLVITADNPIYSSVRMDAEQYLTEELERAA